MRDRRLHRIYLELDSGLDAALSAAVDLADTPTARYIRRALRAQILRDGVAVPPPMGRAGSAVPPPMGRAGSARMLVSP